MKKAISLVEVLVSIMLITTVIVAILQMKDNNFFLLEKFKKTSLYNSYISLAVTIGINRNEKVYLDDIVNFDDNDIRKDFKEVRILVKDKNLKDIILPENEYLRFISVVESNYTMSLHNDTAQQKFYTFKLVQ